MLTYRWRKELDQVKFDHKIVLDGEGSVGC